MNGWNVVEIAHNIGMAWIVMGKFSGRVSFLLKDLMIDLALFAGFYTDFG